MWNHASPGSSLAHYHAFSSPGYLWTWPLNSFCWPWHSRLPQEQVPSAGHHPGSQRQRPWDHYWAGQIIMRNVLPQSSVLPFQSSSPLLLFLGRPLSRGLVPSDPLPDGLFLHHIPPYGGHHLWGCPATDFFSTHQTLPPPVEILCPAALQPWASLPFPFLPKLLRRVTGTCQMRGQGQFDEKRNCSVHHSLFLQCIQSLPGSGSMLGLNWKGW